MAILVLHSASTSIGLRSFYGCSQSEQMREWNKIYALHHSYFSSLAKQFVSFPSLAYSLRRALTQDFSNANVGNLFQAGQGENQKSFCA